MMFNMTWTHVDVCASSREGEKNIILSKMEEVVIRDVNK